MRRRRARGWGGMAVGLAAALSGCLRLEETIELKGDGSGSQELVLSMPEATLAQARLAASVNQVAAADPQALFTRATVERELTEAGLTLARHEAATRDATHTVQLLATFPSSAALRRSPLCGSAAEWTFAPGPAAGTVEVTLFPQGQQAWIDARSKAEAMKTTVDPVADEFFARRRAQLDGLDITVRLRLPGKVLRCTRNLDQTGECEVTAHIAKDQLQTPEDLVRRLAPRFQVVFDASGCPGFPIDR